VPDAICARLLPLTGASFHLAEVGGHLADPACDTSIELPPPLAFQDFHAARILVYCAHESFATRH
jgi:hypothetical protein